VNEVSTAVPGQPRFRLDDHRKISRVKSDSERILIHSLGNDWVDLDDAELETSNVLVSVRESRLDFRSAKYIQSW
jgi:hypothetical protein